MDDAVAWLKKAPFDGGTEVEIRPIFEAEDFGEELTPDLRRRKSGSANYPKQTNEAKRSEALLRWRIWTRRDASRRRTSPRTSARCANCDAVWERASS